MDDKQKHIINIININLNSIKPLLEKEQIIK
jgi:hypothetical protein